MVQLGIVQLGIVQLGVVQLGIVQLGAVMLGAVQLGVLMNRLSYCFQNKGLKLIVLQSKSHHATSIRTSAARSYYCNTKSSCCQ